MNILCKLGFHRGPQVRADPKEYPYKWYLCDKCKKEFKIEVRVLW